METSASQEELDQTISTIEFELKRPDDRVEYDIWYSSANERAMNFIGSFGPINNRLGRHVLMTPHFQFQTCVLGCSKAKQEKLCYGSGKYCAHEDGNPDVPGTDIIDEDLRMICLYKQLYNNEKNIKKHKLWWDYVEKVGDLCYGEVSEGCSKIAHDELDLDWTWTQTCVEESWSKTREESDDFQDDKIVNYLIEAEISYHIAYGTTLFPSIVINNQTYRGQLTDEAVLNALCAGFDVYPPACHMIMESKDLTREDLMDTDMYFQEFDQEVTIHTVVFVSVCVLFCLCIAIYMQRRSAKRELKQ